MKNHNCIIGIWYHWSYADLCTFEELIDKIKDNNRTMKDLSKLDGKKRNVHEIKDYFDRRKSTNFTHFDFCPFCGNKIDWKEMRNRVDE